MQAMDNAQAVFMCCWICRQHLILLITVYSLHRLSNVFDFKNYVIDWFKSYLCSGTGRVKIGVWFFWFLKCLIMVYHKVPALVHSCFLIFLSLLWFIVFETGGPETKNVQITLILWYSRCQISLLMLMTLSCTFVSILVSLVKLIVLFPSYLIVFRKSRNWLSQ